MLSLSLYIATVEDTHSGWRHTEKSGRAQNKEDSCSRPSFLFVSLPESSKSVSYPGYLYKCKTSIMRAHSKKLCFSTFIAKSCTTPTTAFPDVHAQFGGFSEDMPSPCLCLLFSSISIQRMKTRSVCPQAFSFQLSYLYLRANCNGRQGGGYFFPPVPGTCVCRTFFFFSSLNHFGNFPGILILISTKEVHGFYLNIMNSIRFSNTFNFII